MVRVRAEAHPHVKDKTRFHSLKRMRSLLQVSIWRLSTFFLFGLSFVSKVRLSATIILSRPVLAPSKCERLPRLLDRSTWSRCVGLASPASIHFLVSPGPIRFHINRGYWAMEITNDLPFVPCLQGFFTFATGGDIRKTQKLKFLGFKCDTWLYLVPRHLRTFKHIQVDSVSAFFRLAASAKKI